MRTSKLQYNGSKITLLQVEVTEMPTVEYINDTYDEETQNNIICRDHLKNFHATKRSDINELLDYYKENRKSELHKYPPCGLAYGMNVKVLAAAVRCGSLGHRNRSYDASIFARYSK